MADEVVVVAVLSARLGREDELADSLAELAAATHQEPGCRRYAVHRDVDDPKRFVLIEQWETRAALDEHFTQPHMAVAAERAGELVDGPLLSVFCSSLPAGDPSKGAL